MLTLLDRYLARAVVGGTALALTILIALDSLIEFINEAEDVGSGGYTLAQAILVTLLGAPQTLYAFFPTAVLVGSVMGLGNLAAHSELVVLRAAGVSVMRIIVSVLKAGFAMLLVVVAVGELVAPAAEQRAHEIQHAGRVSARIGASVWARDGPRFVNIEEVFPGRRLRGVRVYEVGRDGELRATSAARAVYRGDYWLLEDVRRSRVTQAGVNTEHRAQARWPRLLPPGLLSVLVIEPEQMPAWKLARYVRYLRANELDAARYALAFWTRFTTPLSSLVMLLLAVPFAFGAMRTGGAGQRLFLGILIGLGFHLFNRALNHLALVYGLPAWLGAALPLAVFLGVGLILVKRLR